MQDSFHYIGLPYTLIVDGRGRVVSEVYGFGSAESWDALTSAFEREIARARPAGAAGPEPGGDEHAGHAMPPGGEPGPEAGHEHTPTEDGNHG